MLSCFLSGCFLFDCFNMYTRLALTITKLQIESVPCSDSNRIRAHNGRQIHWSDDYKWVWPQVVTNSLLIVTIDIN